MTKRVAWYFEGGASERQRAKVTDDFGIYVTIQLADGTHRTSVPWYDDKPPHPPTDASYAYAAVSGDTFSLDDLEAEIAAAKRPLQRDDGPERDPAAGVGEAGT